MSLSNIFSILCRLCRISLFFIVSVGFLVHDSFGAAAGAAENPLAKTPTKGVKRPHSSSSPSTPIPAPAVPADVSSLLSPDRIPVKLTPAKSTAGIRVRKQNPHQNRTNPHVEAEILSADENSNFIRMHDRVSVYSQVNQLATNSSLPNQEAAAHTHNMELIHSVLMNGDAYLTEDGEVMFVSEANVKLSLNLSKPYSQDPKKRRKLRQFKDEKFVTMTFGFEHNMQGQKNNPYYLYHFCVSTNVNQEILENATPVNVRFITETDGEGDYLAIEVID
ncbi:MAG: hypothetical protein HQK53_00395 [Oligoflexia bacterium]|nr:hypothetical protein [Oligoflexia bacterium]